MLENYIENLKEEMVTKTQELIRIPSVYQPSNNISKPFGEKVNQALEYMLNLGKSLGFRTKNLDGYCGYIEFGEGEELLGIIGHLDVVPEGEGWTFPPFSGTIYDGKIFGRGAIDDKGPVISSLYAMKAVMETAKVKKRVRLILGLNEENDWKCIEHYKQVEELPTIGFSPDADFPCIYAEKSILSCHLTMDYLSSNESIVIQEIDCKQNALNVVPKFCSILLKIDSKKIEMDDFIAAMKEIIKENHFEIDIYQISKEEIKFTSYGIQSHAAHPDLGVNAISNLILAIYKLFQKFHVSISLFDYFSNYIKTEYDGSSLGIACGDESGKLTLNVGHFSLDENKLTISMNLRIPIHTSISTIHDGFLNSCMAYPNIEFHTSHIQDSLSISKENFLVKSLCEIFNEVTNSHAEPIAIGGATYARAFENCVSFGPNFPGHKDMCHQTDEFIEIDSLLLICKIYAKAILKLAN